MVLCYYVSYNYKESTIYKYDIIMLKVAVTVTDFFKSIRAYTRCQNTRNTIEFILCTTKKSLYSSKTLVFDMIVLRIAEPKKNEI